MYTYGLAVYGVALSGKDFKPFADEIWQLSQAGVIDYLHPDNDDPTSYIGVEVGNFPCIGSTSYDKLIQLLSMIDNPPDGLDAAMDKLRENASPELLAAVEEVDPTVFVVWGTS